MHIVINIRILAFVILAVSAAAANARTLSVRVAQEIPQDTLITLERTVCFGTCPSYKITIEANGVVTFEGRQFVKTIGTAKSTISAQRLRDLLSTFEEIGYFDLRDRYMEPEDGCKQWATDHPSAISSIRINGKTKSVSHYYGCRGVGILADLKKLEVLIDETASSAKWTR